MMSRTKLALAAATLVIVAPVPLWAASSCHDDIGTLEQRLDTKAASAGAAQGSGQKDAAVRASTAVQEKKTGSPAADTAGEGVMAAKVSLNDAKNADKKGDEAGCRRAYDAAVRQAGS